MVEDPSEITAMVRGKSVFYINVLHFTCCLKLPNDGLARQEVIEKVSGGANELIIRPFGRDEPHERPAQEFVEHGLDGEQANGPEDLVLERPGKCV